MHIDHFLHKSDLPHPLQKYWDHEFSSGPCPGPDYLAFQASFGRWLKKLLAGYDVDLHKSHYEFSVVVTRRGKDGASDRYVYMSISDVRFFPKEWVYHILVRQMEHATDWHGRHNHFCQIDQIKACVDELMDAKLEAAI